jgi:hypothetical protein
MWVAAMLVLGLVIGWARYTSIAVGFLVVGGVAGLVDGVSSRRGFGS